MAGIRQVYESLLTKLSSIDVTNQDGNVVKLFARVWNNQVDVEKAGDSEIYPKPAAFVEIDNPVTYEEIGKNYRAADLNILIHLVHEFYNQDGTFAQDLVIFDIRDTILAELSQFQPTGCGYMVSNSETQDTDHDNVYHFVLAFTCHFIDSKGSPYDTGRNVYVEKDPPTELDLQVAIDTEPIFPNIPQPYKIPK